MDDMIQGLLTLAQDQGIPMVMLGYVIYRQQEFIREQGDRVSGFVDVLAEIKHSIAELVSSMADIRSSLTAIHSWKDNHDKEGL